MVTTNGVKHLQGAEYGAVPEIVGTLQTSAIALIIAVPVSIGAALVIVERLPRRLAAGIGMFLELLAGIPERRHRPVGRADLRAVHRARTSSPFIASNIPDVPVLQLLPR